jgi:hypothetical protein
MYYFCSVSQITFPFLVVWENCILICYVRLTFSRQQPQCGTEVLLPLFQIKPKICSCCCLGKWLFYTVYNNRPTISPENNKSKPMHYYGTEGVLFLIELTDFCIHHKYRCLQQKSNSEKMVKIQHNLANPL